MPNRHFLVKFWKCRKAVSILHDEAKALLEVFCLQPIKTGKRQNSSSSSFASWGKIKYMILHWQIKTDYFQKFCRSGLDRIHFYRIRTGLRLKNFTVRSSLVCT